MGSEILLVINKQRTAREEGKNKQEKRNTERGGRME